MRLIATLLWHFPFFGFVSAIYMFLLGTFFTLTIVGAPLGTGLFELGRFYLTPFGYRMVDASDLPTGLSQNPLWRVWGWVMVLLWLPFGIFATIALAIQAALLCLTIIGIPAGVAVARSLGTVLNPVGKKMISADLNAELTRRRTSHQADAYMHRR